MPARITVRAELQSLLNKSQALTDANRLAQLEAERRRREEVAQLAAKRRKEQEEATRRKQMEDPTGRSRRTAAMGQPAITEVAGVWFGLTTTETGLPYPADFEEVFEIRSADFSVSVTQSLGNTRPPSLSGVFFRYVRLIRVFPTPAGNNCIVCYAFVPNNELVNWDPALSGFEIAANHPLQEYWFLVEASAVTAIAPLDYPLFAAAYYASADVDAPPQFTPEAAVEYKAKEGGQQFTASLPGAPEDVGGVYSPIAYGVRRLLLGEPYATVEAFPGHAKYNVLFIPKKPRANFTVPESTLTEGYGFVMAWNGEQPGLCAAELALMGYPPLPPP